MLRAWSLRSVVVKRPLLWRECWEDGCCLADAIPGCLHGPETFPLDGSVRRPAILDCVLDLALRGPPSDVPEASRFAAWVQQGQVGRSLLPWETLVITTDGSFLPSHVQGGLVRCP